MNIKSINIFLLTVITGLVLACKPAEKTYENPNQNTKQPANALLWKIESKDLDRPSYLFGTIHLIGAKDFFLPEGFQEAFNSVNRVVFEIDMDKMNDPVAVMQILPKIMMRGDTSLRDLLSEEDYSLLQQKMRKAGIPLFLFEKVKPMFLSFFADDEFMSGSLQTGEYVSYEMEIMKMAKDAGKTTGGLETMQYQLDVIDSIPYREQARMLMDGIKGSEESGSQLDMLVELYKKQDIDALHKTIKEDDISKYDKILVINRNKNWIPVMEDFMSKEAVLFAVGAGHLGGKQGVIQLLRKKGYKVTPVLKTDNNQIDAKQKSSK